jgi:hypothetical protein
MDAAKKKKQGQRGPRQAPRACGPAAWDVPAWCAQLGIGRTTFYSLKVRPQAVKLGKLCKIIEAPADYTRRVAELQKAA